MRDAVGPRVHDGTGVLLRQSHRQTRGAELGILRVFHGDVRGGGGRDQLRCFERELGSSNGGVVLGWERIQTKRADSRVHHHG